MPKKIILLADGTGNSAASPFKTNVWRFYQAIKQSADQIACYDDGVGTETYKPLAAFCGAFGFGVWKNAKRLYTFLCRNYETGDEVYLFGFSRGAFTVRLLAGLIAKCGVVKTESENALRDNVKKAYLGYRREFLYRAVRARRRWAMFWLRPVLKSPDYDPDHPSHLIVDGVTQHWARIKFIGVWDTVDAYGMPIDEWKRGIDRVVWPMSVADRELSPDIVKARHALALDDERITFWPVLWNEVDRKTGKTLYTPDKLLQVWFAGVHANVGGGYPDDALSYVALDWMMTETDLDFLPDLRTDIRNRADPNGKRYDSRAGLAGYYRYGPRNLTNLCDDHLHGVLITNPLIHQTAVDRVKDRAVPAAPISVPNTFNIIPTGSAFLNQQWMALAWDQVWWHQVTYLLTLLLTLTLLLFPLLEKSGLLSFVSDTVETSLCQAAPIVCDDTRSVILAGITSVSKHTGLDPTAAILKLVPAWSAIWVTSYVQYPIITITLAAALALLFFILSGKIQYAIFDRAERAWWNTKHGAPPPPPGVRLFDIVARVARTYFAWLYSLVDQRLLPLLLGLGTGLFILALAVVTFPFSMIPIIRFFRFLRGTDVSTTGVGTPDPQPEIVPAVQQQTDEEEDGSPAVAGA
jgi:hypothetical protein